MEDPDGLMKCYQLLVGVFVAETSHELAALMKTLPEWYILRCGGESKRDQKGSRKFGICADTFNAGDAAAR